MFNHPLLPSAVTGHRVSNFLFSLFIYFLSSSLTVLFPTYLYKNSFSRKILPEKSLDLFVCKIQSSYFKTFLQCSIIFLEFSRTFTTNFDSSNGNDNADENFSERFLFCQLIKQQLILVLHQLFCCNRKITL